MNYVELHLGDWAQAVAHLSATEEGIYLRLLRRYYADHKPLPADLTACYRIAGARSPDEQAAVDAVLAEFFALARDGHRNKRADEEIQKYLEGEPEREAKRTNERDRQKRTRDRRREMFEFLRAHGVVPAFDTSMPELQKAVDGVTSRNVTRDVTRTSAVNTCDATGNQSPDTIEDQELSSKGEPSTPIAARLNQVTDEAIDAYNRLLAEPLGLTKATAVGIDKKRGYVRRSLKTVREVCREAYGSDRIEPQFWDDYFTAQAADDFIAGRSPRGKGHENWRPDFDYLTRPEVIAKAFERAAA